MKIVFTGGGTLGPVTPLLATAKAIQKTAPQAEFIWYGTPNGPEQFVVKEAGIPFRAISVAKIPRYFSFRLFRFPFDYARARMQAEKFLREDQPDLIVSGGGFTAVPVMRAGFSRHIPCAIHQLDKVPGLSNKMVAKICTLVTTSFPYQTPPFGADVKTLAIATPTRFSAKEISTREDAAKAFALHPKKPIILLVGGGTGAQALNEAMWKHLESLLKTTQIIHVTGKGKGNDARMEGYVQRDLLDAADMLQAYGAADIVLSRAGMGAISELSALKKPTILIPIPRSHQEVNAKTLAETRACILLDQSDVDFSDLLLKTIQDLLVDEEARTKMGERFHAIFPTDDGTQLARQLLKLV